jgi:hypothetical protein
MKAFRNFLCVEEEKGGSGRLLFRSSSVYRDYGRLLLLDWPVIGAICYAMYRSFGAAIEGRGYPKVFLHNGDVRCAPVILFTQC